VYMLHLRAMCLCMHTMRACVFMRACAYSHTYTHVQLVACAFDLSEDSVLCNLPVFCCCVM